MSDVPKTQRVKAIDVKPYRWALWCRIGGCAPFANDIVHRSWAEDGERIVFGLESHNSFSATPEEELELIPIGGADLMLSSRVLADVDVRDAERMAKRPRPTLCATCGGTVATGAQTVDNPEAKP